MKHLKLFFALFAMLALGVGNAWGAALGSGYEKVTNISSLTTGDRVVLYADAISKGVTGANSNNKDATVGDSGWVEYLVEIASGGVYLKDENVNKYIASPGLKNVFKYGTKAVCSVDANGVLKCNNRLLCQNGTYYRMYTSVGSYKPFYVYKVIADAGGDETEDLGDALKWSATSATVQMGADDNEYPTLTNDKNVDVIYSSESEAVATIDANGVVTLVKEGTTTISALYEGGEIDGVTYSAKNVSYTLTVKPAPLVIEPIEGGIIDTLTHKNFAATSSSYANFTGKQATNYNHSDAVYAGRSARNGNATQYSIQLNTIDKGRIATTKTGGLAKRVYVKWSTQATINTNARELYIYGSNTAFTGSETAAPSTKIGTIKYTTGAAEAYVDFTSDYKYILITGSGAIYMDEIHVTWVSAAGTVVTPTISGEAEFVESTEVSIATETGYKVYYTLDGTDPTNASTEYTAPFTVNTTTTVKAIAYDGTSASDVVSATFKALEILTCAEAAALCTTTESADKYVIRGYVTSIPYPYSASNTAPTFWMADTKNGGEVMYAYKVTPVEEADKAVIVGDQVQVIGKIKTYSGKKEVNTGTYTITVPNPKYNVNITSAHGTVTATPAPAVAGEEVTLSVDVESGWVFQNWTVTDASSNNIEVTDNKFTMPASDVTVVANYTESTAADAVLKLSANGVVTSNTYKVGETVKLPETIVNDCVKMFVGWSADANCATTPEYAPGADFTLTAEEHTLYAVYASGTTGETVTIKHNSTATTNMTGNNDANTFFGLDAAAWSIKGDKGGNSNNVGLNKDGTIRLYYAATGGNTLTVTAPSKVATIKLTYNGTLTNAWVKVNGNKVTPTDGVYTIDAETFVIGNANTTNVQVHIKNIAVTLAGELADFSTTCSGALAAPTFSVAEGEYTEAKSVTITAAEGTIYYTLDGTTPDSESTKYTTPIVLDVCGEYTIKAIAISSDNESPVASATYKMDLDIATGSKGAPLTTTEAKQLYESGCYNDELVYVTGQVQNAQFYSSSTYTITLTDGFQFYKFYDREGAEFEDDYIKPGDVIVGYGKIDLYNSNYQLAAGCYLVDYTPNENVLISIKNTVETAYTVEEARNFIDNGATYDLSEEVYVKGIVSKIVTPFDATYGNISYNISADGKTTSAQLQAYRGLSIDGAPFASENDILVGDEVVVVGTLTKYGSTYEFNAGNKLVSKVRKEEPTPEPEVPAVEPIATLIFNTAEGLSNLGITYPATDAGSGALMTEFANNDSFKQDGITMTTTNGTSTVTRVWKAASGALDLRIYTGATLTLSVDEDYLITNIVFTGKNITNLKVDNVAVDNNSWAGSKQSVTFDVAGTTNIYTIAVSVAYTRSISANYGTICLPYASSSYSGAEFYEISWMELEEDGITPKGIWLDEVNGNLTAGKPYIFKATSTVLTVNCTGSAVANPAAGVAGLVGTFKDIKSDNTILEGNYMISGNQFLLCPAGCWLNANRAYIDASIIANHTTKKEVIPGRRRVCLGETSENESTGFENIVAPEGQAVKAIVNGQLIIIRDGVKYNVQGQVIR